VRLLCVWQLLVAGRDRFGIKPLFWTRWQQQLILASEMKALFAYGVPAVWDDETLATGGHLYSHRTVFKGIQQVPPGHFLVATPGMTANMLQLSVSCCSLPLPHCSCCVLSSWRRELPALLGDGLSAVRGGAEADR
jgi:asparagine synthetase B (glutamine-hydrolysing)